MYTIPPTFSKATDMAVTNVATDFTIRATPGANLRYRLVYLKLSLSRTAAAGIIEGEVRDGAGGTLLWHYTLSQPNLWESEIYFPYPGMNQIGVNTGIVLSAISTIAGPTTVRPTIGFFIDNVT